MKNSKVIVWLFASYLITEAMISREYPLHLHIEEINPDSLKIPELSNSSPSQRSFALDPSTWDLYLDKNGNIAVVDGIEAKIQDAKCASRVTAEDAIMLSKMFQPISRSSVKPITIYQNGWYNSPPKTK
jgi:hypothetical protein